MTPPQKPEWIKLTEEDSVPASKKATRALPALVLAVAFSIVGLGAVLAQNGSEPAPGAIEQSVAPVVAPESNPAQKLSNPAVKANPSALAKPAIATLPTGGYDDDDDEEDDYDEEEEDDEEDDD